MTKVNPKGKSGDDLAWPREVTLTPPQADSGPVDTYITLPGIAANSVELTILPDEVGLFVRNPFPIRIISGAKVNSLGVAITQTPFTRLFRYLSTVDNDKNFKIKSEKLGKKYPFYAPLIARVIDGRELGDLYIHVLEDLFYTLDLLSRDEKIKYDERAAAFPIQSASSGEIREFLLKILGELVSYGPELVDLVEHQRARVRADPLAVLELFSPILSGKSRHFDALGNMLPISYLNIVLYLCGVPEEQPVGKINQYSLLAGDDALKLMLFHGPRPYLVASVLTHFDSLKTLPGYLDKNLSDVMKKWVASLDGQLRALALILIITAHVSRDQKLALVLRQLAASNHHENTESILKRHLAGLTEELSALPGEGNQWAMKVESFVSDNLNLDNFIYRLLLMDHYKPSAILSLRRLLNPQNALQVLEASCKFYRQEPLRINAVRHFLTKQNWPVEVRIMAAELALFFVRDPAVMEKLSQMSRHDQIDEVDALINLYRTQRIDGDYVVDNIVRLRGPFKFKESVRKDLIAQKAEWKSKDIKKRLYQMGQKLAKMKDGFEKICEIVFDSGVIAVSEIENLLKRISANPNLLREVAFLINQKPSSIEERKQGLLNLANWQFNTLNSELGIDAEPFAPLKTNLMQTVEQLLSAGDPEKLLELRRVEEALRGPPGLYWQSILDGTPHPDLIHEAQIRLQIFLKDEIQAGLDWVGIMGDQWQDYAALMQHMPEGLRHKHARRLSREPAVQLPDLLSKGKMSRFKTQFENELSGSDTKRVAFVQLMLSRYMHSPLDVLGFMYWQLGLPSTDNGIEFQDKVVSNLTQFLDYFKERSIQVFGPILFTFLDRTHNNWEEILAALFYSNEGDHIHFLPPTLKLGSPTPDLMLISKEGDVKLIEVKKMNWSSDTPAIRFSERLSLVDRQLGGVLGSNKDVRRIAHFRIYLREWPKKDSFLSRVMECLQENLYKNIDEIHLMMSPLTHGADQATYETEVVRVNLRPEPSSRKEERYGAQKAERLAWFINQEGRAHFLDYPILKAVAAMKTNDQLKSLNQDDLMAETNGEIGVPDDLIVDETMTEVEAVNSHAKREIAFEALGSFVVPTTLLNLSPLLGASL